MSEQEYGPESFIHGDAMLKAQENAPSAGANLPTLDQLGQFQRMVYNQFGFDDWEGEADLSDTWFAFANIFNPNPPVRPGQDSSSPAGQG